MKTNQPTTKMPMLKLTFFAIVLSFLACSGSKDDPYKDILALIPQDQNAKEYLKQSVEYYNDVNKALAMSIDSMKGRSISSPLAKLMHENYQNNRSVKGDDINAITFSYGKILQSLKKFNVIHLDKTEVTVLFGRYPTELSAEYLQELGTDQNTYTSTWANKLTCILTYRVPGVPSRMGFFWLPPYPNDNVGSPCPPYCGHEPIE